MNKTALSHSIEKTECSEHSAVSSYSFLEIRHPMVVLRSFCLLRALTLESGCLPLKTYKSQNCFDMLIYQHQLLFGADI